MNEIIAAEQFEIGLAYAIRDYWQRQGFAVNVSVELIPVEDRRYIRAENNHRPMWCIKSDLINGKPRNG